MNAIAKPWNSLRRQIIDGARYHPEHEAHLEATEIPQFVEEAGYLDILESLNEALKRVDDKPRARLCALWTEYCNSGDLPMEKASDFLSALRSAQLDCLMVKAQEIVDEELQ